MHGGAHARVVCTGFVGVFDNPAEEDDIADTAQAVKSTGADNLPSALAVHSFQTRPDKIRRPQPRILFENTLPR